MNKQEQIEFTQRQFIIHQTYANYWQAMAMTGACKLRNTAQGREPTAEEKEQGMTIGWRKKTDEEKVKDALDTMKSHIHIMYECHEAIAELQREEQ